MDEKELFDKQALRELVCRYAQVVDDRNYALVDEVFASDAELVGPGFHVMGREKIRGALRAIERFEATTHAVHNQLVEIDGDQAEGETYCVASHLHERNGVPHKLDWGIRYCDRYRREPEGWRFVRRELIVVWEQDLPLALPSS